MAPFLPLLVNLARFSPPLPIALLLGPRVDAVAYAAGDRFRVEFADSTVRAIKCVAYCRALALAMHYARPFVRAM